MTASKPQHRPDANAIDLFQLVAPLWRQRLRFVLLWVGITVLCLLAGAHLSPRFEARGTVYLDNPSNHGTGGSSDSSLSMSGMLSLLGSGTDLESQKGILQTSDLALDLIRELGINAKLRGPSQDLPQRPFLWQYCLNRNPNRFMRGLYIKDSDTTEHVYHKVRFQLHFTSATDFQVLDALDNDNPVGAGQIGRPVTTAQAGFTLDAYTPVNIEPGATFYLTIQPAQTALLDFGKDLTLEGGGRLPRQNNLISVTYSSDSPILSRQVVQALLYKLVALNQKWATSVSHAIVEFTDAELKKIRDDMDKSSALLAKYEKESGLVAINQQEDAEVKSLVQAEVDLDKDKLTVLNLEQLEKGLDSGRPDMFLLSFIKDPLLEAMGKDLSDTNGKIQAMETQFHGDYPQLDELKSTQQRLLQDMRASVVNFLDRERTAITDETKVVDSYHEKFADVPEKARALTDYRRATQVFQGIYVFLFQEKQKAQMAESSSISNIRVVEEPFVPIRESWPGNVLMAAICALLGLLASAAAVIVPSLSVRWFSTVEEVKAAFGLPVFAVVPHRGSSPGRDSPAIVEGRLQTQFIESIRLLRANLQHTMAGRKHQTVLITSAMPQDGKSSITTNLAITLARSERVNGVLLIDADMHHPSLHGVFSLRQSPGLSEFLNGVAAIDQVIQTVELNTGGQVHVVCAGEVPPSPVELVDSQAMQDLLAYAREHYTFTLLDSPPYPLIATSSVLAPLADRVLCICRLGHTDRGLFRTHVEDLCSFCKHVGLIVNLRELGKRHGATYGSGYGKYGGYHSGEGATLTIKPAGPRKNQDADRPTTPRA